MPGNVVVGGGTGFIGKHLCKLLQNKGYGVTVISRMPGPQRMSWGDLRRKGFPENTVAVVNLAGQNVMDAKRRWTAGFRQNVFNSRINTTSTLATAIGQTKVKPSVFVTMSGVGAYKPDPVKEYAEDSCCESYDFFSNLCQEWENAAKLPRDSEKECRVVTIRSGVVLGADGGMIKQLYLPFYLGLGGPVGSGSQFLPWIHISDLTNIILFAIEQPHVRGILNGVAPQTITNKEFSKAFAKAMKRPAILPVPEFVLNIMLNKERASMLTKGQKVLPKRTESMGYKFLFPDIESACSQLVNLPTKPQF